MYGLFGVGEYNEKFIPSNDEINFVTDCKYLGINMSTRLSLSPSQNYNESQPNRACSAIYSVLYYSNFRNLLGLKFFKRGVVSFLTYGGKQNDALRESVVNI